MRSGAGPRTPEQTDAGAVVRSYLWGMDLSGTFQGAGGIGGLIAVNMAPLTRHNTHFALSDGNGNIVGLVNAETGTGTADYEYGPFGELLRRTGPAAENNPFQFSSKYCDPESGLLYYGYRYYCPAIGRWINRDPAKERGGVNLYGFSRNCSPNVSDPDGRQYVNPNGQLVTYVKEQDEYWYRGFPESEVLEWDIRLALASYFYGVGPRFFNYGPDHPWTKALQKHQHMDGFRERIRKSYRKACASNLFMYMDAPPAGSKTSGRDNFDLNALGAIENAKILMRDILAAYSGMNMAYTTGSILFAWEQLEVSCCRNTAKIHIVGSDRLRMSSNSRIPTRRHGAMLPDEPFGPNGPFRTVYLEWAWDETQFF